MKTKILFLAVASCLALPPLVLAQAPKAGEKKAAAPRSAADLARDEFNKARTEPGGKLDQARFERVITPALAFLRQYPTNTNANAVIRDLVGWPDTVKMDRKTQAAQRVAYLSHLRYMLLNERYKEDLSDDAKAALGALDVALADAELRESPNPRAGVAELREKLDAFSENPKAGRYLADREISYVQILGVLFGPERSEAHLKKLAEHKEKAVADVAKRELSLIQLRREPADWKITTMDGKEFDFAQNRGKIIALYFWSTGTRDNSRHLDMVKQVQADYRRKGIEVVSVSYDRAEDREKLEKYIKENGIKFPVAFDGKGNRNEFGSKLNITSGGRIALFDKNGLLAYENLEPRHLEPAVKKLLEPPAKKKT